MKFKPVYLLLAVILITTVALFGCTQTAPAPAPAPAPTPTPAPAPQVIKWRLQGYLPTGHSMQLRTQAALADMVKKLSNGRFEITALGAGEAVGAMEVSDAVSKGILDMGHWFAGYDQGKSLVADLFANTPFVGSPMVWQMWFANGGGFELEQKFYDKYNIHTIPVSLVGPPSIEMVWAKPVRSFADRKGLKLRAAGIHAEVMKKLGASVVSIALGDVYTALQQGTVDGAELASPSFNYGYKLQEVGKYISYPGWHEPSPASTYIVNKQKWDALPDDLKYILVAAAQAVEDTHVKWQIDDSATFLDKIMKENGVQIIQTSPADLAMAYDLVQQVQAERAAKDPFYAEVLKSVQDYVKKVQLHESVTAASGYYK